MSTVYDQFLQMVYWIGPSGERTTTRPDRPVFIDRQWWDGAACIIEYHLFEFDY
jgi:hypothetical protein